MASNSSTASQGVAGAPAQTPGDFPVDVPGNRVTDYHSDCDEVTGAGNAHEEPPEGKGRRFWLDVGSGYVP